jgi:serine protease Do
MNIMFIILSSSPVKLWDEDKKPNLKNVIILPYREGRMNKTKLFTTTLVSASMVILSACSTAGLALNAPAEVVSKVQPLSAAPQVINPQTAGGVDALQSAYEAIYQNVNPSVVTIINSSQNGQGQVTPTAEGSGFVWDASGHVVTNNHVVAGAAKLTVNFSDGSSYDAKVVGTDADADLAVIQVTNAPASVLKPITVGDSTQVKVGQMVVAIGNPFGLSSTMTTGIVSAIGRSIAANPEAAQASNAPSYSIPDIIQTDAAINPGNSGGVLVDDQGRLIGVTAAMESSSNSSSGVGFVIPSAIVQKVVPSLISTGKYDHPYLGLSGTTLTADLAQAMNLKASQPGVLVMTVVDNGPAAKAGLKPSTQTATVSGQQVNVGGDLITAVNGQAVKRFEDLTSYLLSQTQPGQTVTLTVLRGGQEQSVKVTLGTIPSH